MNKDRLAHLRSLCENATPGPWVVKEAGYVPGEYIGTTDVMYDQVTVPQSDKPENLAFIAEARTALPEALAAIEELQGEVMGYKLYMEQDKARIQELEARVLALTASVEALEAKRQELEGKAQKVFDYLRRRIEGYDETFEFAAQEGGVRYD